MWIRSVGGLCLDPYGKVAILCKFIQVQSCSLAKNIEKYVLQDLIWFLELTLVYGAFYILRKSDVYPMVSPLFWNKSDRNLWKVFQITTCF